MNKSVTMYGVMVSFRNNKLQIDHLVWEGEETKLKYKVKLVEANGARDVMDISRSYKLADKNSIDKPIFIHDGFKVYTLNKESIPDWEGILVRRLAEYLQAVKEEAESSYYAFMGLKSNWEFERNKNR